MVQLFAAGRAVQETSASHRWRARLLGVAAVLLLGGWMPAAVAANLEISSLEEVTDPVPAGGIIEYKLVLHNGGPESVGDGAVAFDLPVGSTAVNLPSSCLVDPLVSTRVVCKVLDTLVNGEDYPLTLQVSTAGMQPGTVNIAALVGRGDGPDPNTPLGSVPGSDPFLSSDSNPSDNLATQNTTLIAAGDLQLVKAASPDPVVAGAEVTYTITVTNHGPSVSTDFNVADSLPSGVSYVPNSAQAVSGSWTFNNQDGTHAGSLAVGQSASYSFKGKVDVASGSVVNSATVNAVGTPDPNTGNNSDDASVTVAAGADLAIDKTAAPLPGIPGELITFTVTSPTRAPARLKTWPGWTRCQRDSR